MILTGKVLNYYEYLLQNEKMHYIYENQEIKKFLPL